jgi:hypothetical protein
MVTIPKWVVKSVYACGHSYEARDVSTQAKDDILAQTGNDKLCEQHGLTTLEHVSARGQ